MVHLCLAACLQRPFNSRAEGSLGLNSDKDEDGEKKWRRQMQV